MQYNTRNNVTNSKLRKQWITKIDELKNSERLAQQKLIQISNQLYQQPFQDEHSLVIKNQTRLPYSKTNIQLPNNKSNIIFKNNTIQLYRLKQKNKTIRSHKPHSINFINYTNYINSIETQNDGKYKQFTQTSNVNFSKPKSSFTNFIILDDRDNNPTKAKKKYYRSRKNKTLYSKLFNPNRLETILLREQQQNKAMTNRKNYNSLISKVEEPKMQQMIHSLYNINKNPNQISIKLSRK